MGLIATTPDGQLSTNWLDSAGDFAVSGGQAIAKNAGTNEAVLVPTVSQANVKVLANVLNLKTGASAGFVARYAGPGDNNEYIGQIFNNGPSLLAQIYKKVNGVVTLLKSSTLTAAQATTFADGAGIDVTTSGAGTTLQLIINGNGTRSGTPSPLSPPDVHPGTTAASVGIRGTTGVTLATSWPRNRGSGPGRRADADYEKGLTKIQSLSYLGMGLSACEKTHCGV